MGTKIYTSPCWILRADNDVVTNLEAHYILPILMEAIENPGWGNAVGMAAPQVGVNSLMFVALGEVYINPWIWWRSKKKTLHLERCFSLEKEKDYPVKRPNSIIISWMDMNNKRHNKRFTGFEAQVIQHEYDHIEGKLLIDYGVKK